MKKILLIDDDITFSEALIFFLEKNNFKVTYTKSASLGLSHVRLENFDLILLDLNMPELHGSEVCKKIKNKFNTPIIVISADSTIQSKQILFDIGCNDFLVKPILPEELIIRIDARIRDFENIHNQKKELKLKKSDNNFFLDEKQLKLTINEQILLDYLFLNKNRLISKEEISELFKLDDNSRMVDKYISVLRKKLEPNPKKPVFIESIYAQGIIFHNN